MQNSKIVIGTMSTMLRENLSLMEKLLHVILQRPIFLIFQLKDCVFQKVLIILILKNNCLKYIKCPLKNTTSNLIRKLIMFVTTLLMKQFH